MRSGCSRSVPPDRIWRGRDESKATLFLIVFLVWFICSFSYLCLGQFLAYHTRQQQEIIISNISTTQISIVWYYSVHSYTYRNSRPPLSVLMIWKRLLFQILMGKKAQQYQGINRHIQTLFLVKIWFRSCRQNGRIQTVRYRVRRL